MAKDNALGLVSKINSELDKATAKADKLVKSLAGGGGGGGTGGNSMSNSLARIQSTATTALRQEAGIGMIQGVAKMVSGGMAMMPDVAMTVQRAGTFYQGAVVGGGMMGTKRLANMTAGYLGTGFSNEQSAAEVNAALSGQYMMPGTARFKDVVTAAGNATKYLNMDTAAAASAFGGLTTGQSSANFMRRYGMFTGDPRTGKPLNQDQIFNQLKSRMIMQPMNTEETMDELNRGFLGSNIRNSGMTPDQQFLFAQKLIEESKGKSFNYSDPNAVKDAIARNEKLGIVNPFAPAQSLNATKDSAMQSANDTYIKAIKDATGVLETFVKVGGALANGPLGYLNAGAQTLGGDSGGSGAMNVLGGIGQTALAAYAMVKAPKLVAKILGKGGTEATKAAVKTGAGAAAAAKGAAAAKVGSKAAAKGATAAAAGATAASKGGTGLLKGTSKLIKGSAAISAVGGGLTYAMGDDNPWDDWESFAGGAVVGGITGSFAGGVGAVPGALIGGTVSYLGNAAGYYATSWWDQTFNGGKLKGSLFAEENTGGESSRVGTGGTTDTTGGSGGGFLKPVEGGYVSARYGEKGSIWAAGYHKGTDYAVPVGTPIYAAADGKVSAAQSGSGSHSYGLYIKIDHGGGYATLYGHLSQTIAKPGDTVTQGQLIAKSGESGHVSGPHLHFEVFLNGVSVDPGSLKTGGLNKGGSDKPANKGKKLGKGSKPNVLDIVMNGTSGTSSPVSSSMSGVTGNNISALELIGKNMKGGQAAVYNPVSSATGMLASQSSQGPVGGPASNIGLGSTSNVAQGAPDAGELTAIGKRVKDSGNSSRPQVNIAVHVARASELEAKNLAAMVKRYLEEDELSMNMARR